MRYTADAEEDLTSLYAYLGEQAGLSVADRLIDALVTTCDRLGDFPQLGRRRSEFDALGFQIRSIAEGRYTIFYTDHDEMIYIVRVVHGARDPDESYMTGLEDIFPK